MADDDNIIHVNFGGNPVPPSLAPEDPTAHEKLAVFSEMVDKGTVMLTLDCRIPGVSVPSDYADQLQLNLNFDYNFGIADFAFDDDGVRASLSFGGVDYWCDIPWAAVYMLRSLATDEGVAFPASLPEEVRALIPQFESLLEEE